MHRYFIHLSYKGTRYHGWQIQPNALTVQEVLDSALQIMLDTNIETLGCGRTDTGVHAREFYAHFDLAEPIKNTSLLTYKLNKFLPADIAVKTVLPVTVEAHARFSAVSRTYEYKLSREKDPFQPDLSLYYYGELDVEQMNKAALLLFTQTDFSCFSKSNTQVYTNNCHIMEAEWQNVEDHFLIFRITANRFLRNMVRAIVGTLLEIGKKNITIDEFEQILKSKNRSNAGASVPAEGLTLTKVIYPEHIWQNS